MKKADQYVIQIAERQHQLITRDQFLVVGSRQQISRRLITGELIRVHDSVYRLPGFAPSWRQSLLAACFAAGRYCVASFRAALCLMALPGGEELIEITCPRHRRAQYEGVIAHESRFLDELKDVFVLDGIPLTRAARTLCDAAGLVEMGQLDAFTLDHALLEAVRRNLVDVASVWRECERVGGETRLGGEAMMNALQRFVPPARQPETTAETLVLQTLRANGVPEPVPQYWITLPNGERIRLDFAWPERRAALEWDPYWYHGDRERYEVMQRRTRLMRAMNWERVCVTDNDLDAGMPESLAALASVLAVRL